MRERNVVCKFRDLAREGKSRMMGIENLLVAKEMRPI